MILIQQKFKKYRDINNFIVCTNNSHKSIHLLHSQIVNRENHFIVHYLYEEITKLVEQHILKHFQQKTTDSSIFSLKHIRCNECKRFKKKKKSIFYKLFPNWIPPTKHSPESDIASYLLCFVIETMNHQVCAHPWLIEFKADKVFLSSSLRQ